MNGLVSSIQTAVEHGYDLRVLEWWLKKYMPGQNVVSMACVFRLAITYNQFLLLEWINQAIQSELPRLPDPVSFSDPDIVVWLHNHSNFHSCVRHNHCSLHCARLFLTDLWRLDANVDSIKWCIAYEDHDCAFKIQRTRHLVPFAIERRQVDLLQWLHERRPNVFASRRYLQHAIRRGCLEVAVWLHETFPKHHFKDPCFTFDDKTSHAYDVDHFHWVLCEFSWKDETKRLVWMESAIVFAAGTGTLDILAFVYMLRIEYTESLHDASEANSNENPCDSIFSTVVLE